MKTIFNDRLGTLLLAAALLLAPMSAAPQGTAVEIKSVDNYAGNSNVYTNQPNTTVTVTELDADKKPVRTYTGTTDSEGKLTIQAGHNLSKPYLRAATADPKSAEFYLPSSVSANEPFTFSTGSVVEGEVVDVKTVEGEVVSTKRADKLGRVFLPAGLAAGTYLISATRGNNSRLHTLNVPPQTTGQSGPDNTSPMVQNTDPGNLSVPNAGNAMDLVQTIGGKTVPVLAASTSEIVFGAPAQSGVKPGHTFYSIEDKDGNALQSGDMVVYSANAKLTNVTVPSGSETHLVVTIEPKDLQGDATATIVSGPVTFSNGASQQTLPVQNGQAEFAVQSQPGTNGKFQVAWNFDPLEAAKDAMKSASDAIAEAVKGLNKGGGGDTKALEDDGWVKFKDDDGRTGKKKIIQQGEGFKREAKVYDDGTTVTTTERTGQKRQTVETETNSSRGGERTVVTETMEYEKTKDGWKAKSGKRVTKKIVGGTSTETTETWSPTAGWH